MICEITEAINWKQVRRTCTAY